MRHAFAALSRQRVSLAQWDKRQKNKRIRVLQEKCIFTQLLYIYFFFEYFNYHAAPLCNVCQGRARHKAPGTWRVASCVLSLLRPSDPPSFVSLRLQRRSRQLCVEISCCCRLLLPYARGVACRGGTQLPLGCRSLGVRRTCLGSIRP